MTALRADETLTAIAKPHNLAIGQFADATTETCFHHQELHSRCDGIRQSASLIRELVAPCGGASLLRCARAR